jgi:RNA polymerase sigma-70 factor, ECF subfamily
VTQGLGVDGVSGRELAEPGGAATRAVAFTRLADEHLDASYRLARAIMDGQAEAEDATHDALIQAWRHWGQLRDHARFEQWFDRILVNTCRERLRRKKRWFTQDLSPDLAVAERDAMGQADARDEMRVALAELSPDHRVVVALRYYRDLTIEQIAERLGIAPGTVNSRLHYALRHLRTVMADAQDAGGDR